MKSLFKKGPNKRSAENNRAVDDARPGETKGVPVLIKFDRLFFQPKTLAMFLDNNNIRYCCTYFLLREDLLHSADLRPSLCKQNMSHPSRVITL